MMDTVGNFVVMSHATGSGDPQLWTGLWAVHRRLPASRDGHLEMELVEEGETQPSFDDMWAACDAGRAAGIARAKDLAAAS